MKAGILKDRQMLDKCFLGDKKTLEDFIRRFSPLICNTVSKTLAAKNVWSNQQDIEDLHNTVFIKLIENDCKKLHQYKGLNGCSLATWLRVVTVRIVLNDIRQKFSKINGSHQNRQYLEDIEDLKANEPGITDLMIRMESEKRVQKGLKKLSARDRMFLRLHIENNLSLKDVAETMGLTMGSAYTLKHRAVSSLREIIMNEEQTGND